MSKVNRKRDITQHSSTNERKGKKTRDKSHNSFQVNDKVFFNSSEVDHKMRIIFKLVKGYDRIRAIFADWCWTQPLLGWVL